jgi:hypothetical protein
MELVYQYLTGPRFRHRIEAVVERFSDMQADRERKTMMRLWAKRGEQIIKRVCRPTGVPGAHRQHRNEVRCAEKELCRQLKSGSGTL